MNPNNRTPGYAPKGTGSGRYGVPGTGGGLGGRGGPGMGPGSSRSSAAQQAQARLRALMSTGGDDTPEEYNPPPVGGMQVGPSPRRHPPFWLARLPFSSSSRRHQRPFRSRDHAGCLHPCRDLHVAMQLGGQGTQELLRRAVVEEAFPAQELTFVTRHDIAVEG